MPNAIYTSPSEAGWDVEPDGPEASDRYDIYARTDTEPDADGVIVRAVLAGNQSSPQAFAAAFDFLQRNADGRYTDRTLMAISRWGFRCDEALRRERRLEDPRPWVLSVHREVTYDEDTEVKSGGTMACAVTIPAEYGNRLVMAVHPDARRQGFGRRLLNEACDYVAGLHAYVGSGNRVGQQFLLSAGMMPMSMSNGRSILYAFENLPEGDGVAR